MNTALNRIFMSIGLLGIVLSGAVLSAPAQAQALKPEELSQIKTEVLATVTHYFTAFNAQNTKEIGEKVFTNPGLAMSATGVAVNTPEQVDKQYAGNLQRLQEQGWEKSVMGQYDVCVMNANVAFASGKFTRLRKDGSVLQAGASTYMLNKGKDGWRIAMLIGTDANKTVTCN